MRVLVAAPYANMNAVFETDLEIIQRHLDAGDDVTVLVCDADLPSCEPNNQHHLNLCVQCVSRRRVGLGLLGGGVDVRPLVRLRTEDRVEISRLPRRFSSLAQLCAVTLEQFDLGWGVLSSIVSATFTPEPDLRVASYSDLAARGVVAAAAVYRSVQHHVDDLRPERVYVFNGRFANTRAVFRAARSRGVDCYMHERASTFRHYVLFKNRLSHDPDYFQDLIREHWSQGDAEERSIMGASFFIEAARGVSHAYKSFVTQQRDNALPAGFDPSQNNVAVYTSSDFEFAAIGDVMPSPIYRDQYEGLRQVIRDAQSDRSMRLWIRMHPNASLMKESVLESTLAMQTENATIIPPGSPVSTYALMRAANRVLTFGSTTGIEAVYWGTPSVLGNRSYYDSLGGTYNPSSHVELMALLQKPGLEAKDKAAALMYGFYTRTYGTLFRHFQPTGLGGGPFRGNLVRPTPPARIAARALAPITRVAGKIHLGLLNKRLAH